jgi:uncharacterized membrane protein
MATHQSKHQSDNGHHNGLNHSANVNWPERIISMAAGTFLMYNGLKRIRSNPKSGIAKAALGSALLYRGASGNCPVYKQLHINTNTHSHEDIIIQTSMIIDKDRLELYEFWRRLENLPRFMTHLASVKEIDGERSHWEAWIPGGLATIKWDAEIVEQIPGELLSWRSVEGSDVENDGVVKFVNAGQNKTELRVLISYRPPAGAVGSALAKLFNPVFEKIVRGDIDNFKEFIEDLPETDTRGMA